MRDGRQKKRALRRQFQAFAPADEQQNIEGEFQRSDLMADRTVRHIEFARSGRNRSAPRGRLEGS